MRSYSKYFQIDTLALITAIIFTAAAILVSLNRFWQYDILYYDFGIFDRAIWQVSRFHAPVIDHLTIAGKWIFADHLNPSVFIYSILYWFTSKSEAILVAQAVTVGLSGLVIYFIANKIQKNKIASFAVLIAYFLFTGLQNAVITDFHEVTVATLFLALTFWAFITKKHILYFISLILTLGFKESMFAVGIGLAIAIYLLDKKAAKIAIGTLVLAILWGLVSIKIIIPHFSGGFYLYEMHYPDNPLQFATSFVDDPQKIRTIFFSFSSFIFLPLLSPAFFALFVQDLFSRFYALMPGRWTLAYHYSAILAVALAISSAYALKRIKNKTLLNIVSFLLVANSLILFRFILHGPLLLAINPDFYRHTKDFIFLENVVTKVPQNASIMTQNNIASHFTHQPVYLIRNDYEKYGTDYILIDDREGQSPSDYFGSHLKLVLEKLSQDNNYELIYKQDEQVLYKKRR